MAKRSFQFTQNEQFLAIISIASTGLAISWFSEVFLFTSLRFSGYFSTLYLLKKYLPVLEKKWNGVKFDILHKKTMASACF